MVNLDSEIDEFEDRKGVNHYLGNELLLDVSGFEGPIDVLLNLARGQKVDLKQISILDLADQYLSWVSKLSSKNLELAADYLVMAAWLAYLKSRLLIPDLSVEEEPSGEAMAAALQFQLLRLKSMQDSGEKLFSLNILGEDFFTRGESEYFGVKSNTTHDVNLFDLLSAYGEHRGKLDSSVFTVLPSDLFSPADAMKWLAPLLGQKVSWTDLSAFLPGNVTNDLVGKSMFASALVATLQLTKEGNLKMKQAESFGKIFISTPS